MSWVDLRGDVEEMFAVLAFDPWVLFEEMAHRKPIAMSLAFDHWAESKAMARTERAVVQCCGNNAAGPRCKRHRNTGSPFCALHAPRQVPRAVEVEGRPVEADVVVLGADLP